MVGRVDAFEEVTGQEDIFQKQGHGKQFTVGQLPELERELASLQGGNQT